MREDRAAARLSLRLISTSRLIERRVDQLMRARFASSIARFDFLSALDRHGPLTLGAVSAHLLVSNGNVTGLATRLKQDGLIESVINGADRRVQTVQLTRRGESVFKKMARAHQECVDALLGELPRTDRNALIALLDQTKASIRHAGDREAAQ